MTLLSTTTLSGSTTTISSISGDYIDLYVVIENLTKSAGENVKIFINNDSNQNYYAITYTGSGTTFGTVTVYKEAFSSLINPGNSEQDLRYDGIVYFYNYASTGQKKKVDRYNFHTDDGSPGTTLGQGVASYWWNSTNAINELKFDATSGTFSGGTVKIYGVK